MSSTTAELDLWMADFFKQTSNVLLAALRKLLESSEAEEVMQEAYVEVYLGLKAGKEIEPKPFLFRVARNIAISRLRHKKVVERSATQVSEFYTGAEKSPQALQTDVEEKALLLEAVNSLPYICRQVFVMRKLHGKTHAEIAQMMHISLKTVENHLATGMKLCRQYIIKRTNNNIALAKKLSGAA